MYTPAARRRGGTAGRGRTVEADAQRGARGRDKVAAQPARAVELKQFSNQVEPARQIKSKQTTRHIRSTTTTRHIRSHRITSFQITSNQIKSSQTSITSRHITSHHITSHHIKSSHHMKSNVSTRACHGGGRSSATDAGNIPPPPRAIARTSPPPRDRTPAAAACPHARCRRRLHTQPRAINQPPGRRARTGTQTNKQIQEMNVR